MSARTLLVTGSVALTETLLALVAEDEAIQLEVSDDPGAATGGRLAQVDALIVSRPPSGLNVIETLRRIRSDHGLVDLPVIITAAPGDPAGSRACAAGASAVMEDPVDARALLAQVRELLVARRHRSAERQALRDLDSSVRRLADLILDLADAVHPGIRTRGEEVAWIAGRLAERFSIPERYTDELLSAARLHAVGSAFLREAMPVHADPWRWAQATAGELRMIPALAGAGELVSHSAEHWDGSGRAGLQRGQIPLRARIIRVAVDLVDTVLTTGAEPSTESLQKAARTLGVHRGTRYDPAVIAELEMLLSAGEPASERVRWVSVEELRPGMKLAEDLVTASGVKLLAAGGVISAGSLRTISRRHVTDPIAHAIPVQPLDG